MRNTRIGLLPLYVELYDRTMPQLRPQIDEFHKKVVGALEGAQLTVHTSNVCRTKKEFNDAIQAFTKKDVDAIVTLHLAYSPSLESEGALKNTQCPILILDTTPSYCFDQSTDEAQIMLNHGIHGVQDMCNLLKRNNKIYSVFAGHIEHSDVIDRIKKAADMAKAAKIFQTAKVGIIGEPFEGMGDFQVQDREMRDYLGIEAVRYDWEKGAERIGQVSQEEIDAEFEQDKNVFEIDKTLARDVYDRSARTGLGVRKWVRDEGLSAFTINFLATAGSRPGLPVMPFVECCKAMAAGIGYAGEGDVITAGLVGALLSTNPNVTFSEMFCPDWKNGSVFMSHMGEFNYNVASGKPFLTEKEFEFTDAQNPTVAYSTMKGGEAVLVNLAPLRNGRFLLLVKKGEMTRIDGENKLGESVNGWFRPEGGLGRFLEEYSKNGGTHHNVIVYGETPEALGYFAEYCGLETIIL